MAHGRRLCRRPAPGPPAPPRVPPQAQPEMPTRGAGHPRGTPPDRHTCVCVAHLARPQCTEIRVTGSARQARRFTI